MSAFVESGRIVDLILAIVVLEAALLLVLRARTGRGLSAADLLPNLASGACLLLAARAALTGAAWHWIALALAGAGAAHVVDLWRRLR